MSGPSPAALRLRRLERLRDAPPSGTAVAAGGTEAVGPGGAAETSVPELTLVPAALEPVRRGRTQPEARTLAAALDGEVIASPAGPVVIAETVLRLPARLDGLAELPVPVDPGTPFVCLDTETTGLGTAAGTVPFLIGIGTWEADRFRVRQLLMPDHPSERALLGILSDLLPPDTTLVTYNGRAFDWPLIVTRYRMHGRAAPRYGAHLDLLTLARQVWKHRLPDARLANVEAGVAG
ncbi:MAG: ribonuclease H-like domain-containing protein, partial [Chloroflexota bacterium]